MKLLGVELTNYACFDRQFTPLRPGINLLVGKNNAGKTAILRALGALATLPLANGRPMPTELLGYCRQDSPSFGLNILYQMEASESQFFHISAQTEKAVAEMFHGRLKEELQRGEVLARWRFTVLPANALVAFEGCVFELRSPAQGVIREATALARADNGQLILHHIMYPEVETGGSRTLAVPNTAGPGGAKYPLLPSDGLPSCLRVFQNVKLINPHRVVMNRQMLQTASILPGDAQNLGPVLQTLQGNNRETFEQIEAFVTKVFPEFRYLNAASKENNQLSIYLTERTRSTTIPLENCGTGVEQIIALATFVLTAPKPSVILLDEPHSYLHPTAERALVELLHEHSEHYFVVSTHSAVLMNSVASNRITHVVPPGQTFKFTHDRTSVAKNLLDLGYRNSDSLFYDRLVFVEGKSDKVILPILLEKDGEIESTKIERTGFPTLEGAPKGSSALQVSIHRHEKLLSSIAGCDLPRVYIFDGDRNDDEKNVLSGTKKPTSLESLPIKFLPRLEIENYLLVAEAISAALEEELLLQDRENETSINDVKEFLTGLLESEDRRVFPQGKKPNGDRLKEAKGSIILENLYEHYGLPYHKEHSGLLIAKHITAMNQPALSELTNLVRFVFVEETQQAPGANTHS